MDHFGILQTGLGFRKPVGNLPLHGITLLDLGDEQLLQVFFIAVQRRDHRLLRGKFLNQLFIRC